MFVPILPPVNFELSDEQTCALTLDQSHALHALRRDDAMVTGPGNAERPHVGPFGLRM
jgi:hypothetical protein